MKSTRKWLAVITLLTLLLPLVAACGTTPAPATGGEGQPAEVTVEVTRIVEKECPEEAPKEEIPEGAIVIDFWHAFGGGRKLLIERMVADYNYTHPGVYVRVENKGSYRDTLNAAILAAQQGNPPHIVQIFEVGSQLALDSGIFVPFEDNAPDWVNMDDLIGGVSNYYRFEGKFYSMPWNSSNPILYYNKDMFRAAGLDPEKPPETFEEMLDACDKIVSSGTAKNCVSWPLHSWFFEQWMANMGAELANNGNGREARATEVYLTSDAAKEIVSWWKEMYDKGYYAYSGKLEDWDGADAIFVSGQAAMEITSTSDVVNRQNDAAENGFELGTGYLPYPANSERQGVIVGGASMWMSGGHPDEEMKAATDFVTWFTNTENAIRWHKATGYFPIRKSAVTVLEGQQWFERNPAYRAAFDQLLNTKDSNATRGAVIGAFPEVRTIIEQAIEKVLAGQASVDEALQQAKEEADKAVEDYNKSVE
ncbi:MAG TPA: ABC transporter substrate-binding protein [Anaerolineae bacterium]|nr:ABC transporter substrate-binding protein [Anaerolineae bacterium]